MASLQERRLASGELRWDVVYWYTDPATGKRKQKRERFADEKQALWRKLEVERESERGLLVVPTDETVEERLARFLASLRLANIAANTYKIREMAARRYIVPYLGKQKFATLAPSQIIAWLDLLRKRGLATNTQATAWSTLSAVYRQAYEMGEIDHNPLDRVPRSLRPKSTHRAERPLPRPVIARLVEDCQSHHLGRVVAFLALTGTRIGEALGIAWKDVDWEAREVTIDKQVALVFDGDKYARVVRKGTKTGKSRVVPLHQLAIDLLHAQWKWQEEQRRSCFDWQETGLVFTSARGTILKAPQVERWWRKRREQYGIPSFRLHDFRHTFATYAVAAHEDVVDVARILGHANPAITLSIYAHGTRRQSIVVEKVFDGLFG